MHSIGFGAFAREDARLLILGSLPGQASLAQGRYYGYPRNGFWPIMGELAGARLGLAYEERIEKLLSSGIALWDVCAEGYRPGSLDSNISEPVPNDFAGFLPVHPQIRLIAFNGQPAAKLYRRLVLPHLPGTFQEISQVVLPSTSPAHASLSQQQKLARWRDALAVVLS